MVFRLLHSVICTVLFYDGQVPLIPKSIGFYGLPGLLIPRPVWTPSSSDTKWSPGSSHTKILFFVFMWSSSPPDTKTCVILWSTSSSDIKVWIILWSLISFDPRIWVTVFSKLLQFQGPEWFCGLRLHLIEIVWYWGLLLIGSKEICVIMLSPAPSWYTDPCASPDSYVYRSKDLRFPEPF